MSIRTERVASLLKEELGAVLVRDYSNPSYGFITVTEGHGDLGLPRSICADGPEEKLAMLERAAASRDSSSKVRLRFIRSAVRTTPRWIIHDQHADQRIHNRTGRRQHDAKMG
jgi:hypothetical protein